MIDAAKYDKIETLKNGTAVRIRSIRADDKDRISEAFRNLETELIYTRFFQNKKALTVFSRSGLPMKKSFESGTTHVTLALKEAVA